MKNILVPVDFSEATVGMLDTVIELASAFDAKVWILHVAEPEPTFIGYDVGPDYIDEAQAHLIYDNQQAVQVMSQSLHAKGIKANSLLIQGVTIDTILKEADKLKADLIVLSPHKHEAIYQALVGSVSEGVLRKATCPVLLIPDKSKENKDD